MDLKKDLLIKVNTSEFLKAASAAWDDPGVKGTYYDPRNPNGMGDEVMVRAFVDQYPLFKVTVEWRNDSMAVRTLNYNEGGKVCLTITNENNQHFLPARLYKSG